MASIKRETNWCSIDIDTSAGKVLLTQRWFYVWNIDPGQRPWTLAEKQRFHRGVDQTIWEAWSNHARLSVSGGSDLARRFATRGMSIDFDIVWVLSNRQWTVVVSKVAPGAFIPSAVDHANRIIDLDTNDLRYTAGPGGRVRKQKPVAHEFGHTIAGREDEYMAKSPHRADAGSVMNVGNQLRARHFQRVVAELNQMLPDTRFAIGSIS